MLEPIRPDSGRLRMALSCAGTFDQPVAKIIAEELRWREWVAWDLQERFDRLTGEKESATSLKEKLDGIKKALLQVKPQGMV